MAAASPSITAVDELPLMFSFKPAGIGAGGDRRRRPGRLNWGTITATPADERRRLNFGP